MAWPGRLGPMMRLSRCAAALATAVVALLTALPALAADKIDTVVLNNGDRVTCEIKQLDRGRLKVGTDPMDDVVVHWGDIVSLISPRTFEVEDLSGQTYYGSLKAGDAGSLVVSNINGDAKLALLDVVRISPLEQSFWSRIDGNIDLGFSFSQASEQTQWTLNANANYRRARTITQTNFSSQFTDIEGAESTSRNAFSLSSRRLVSGQWFSGGFGQYQQDESLGLNSRIVLGGAVGRYLLHRPDMTFSVFSGAAYTQEHFEGEDIDHSAEAIAGTDWDWFTLGNNDTDLSSTLISYYNISGRARVRVDFNTTYTQKMFKDLHWSINVFDNYDGAPPEGQKSNDFGVSLALGWDF